MIFQPGKYLRVYYDGFGNINYEFPGSGGGGAVLTAADDGLSTDLLTGKTAQLGQTVSRPGDPAALNEDREIPFAGHRLFFGKNSAGQNVIGFDPDNGIDISNNNGAGIQFFWDVAPNANQLLIFTDDSLDIVFDFDGSGTNLLVWNGQSTFPGKFNFTSPVISDGFGTSIQTLTQVAHPAYAVLKTDATLLLDTTGGNMVINMDPAVILNQVLNIKKISGDANTVTLTPTSGTIQELGAAAATFVFSVQGENITVQNDGTNFYIL